MSKWEDFLSSSIINSEHIDQLRRWMALFVTGQQPKKILLLVGPAQSGKSVLLNLLRDLVGSDYSLPFAPGVKFNGFCEVIKEKRLLVFHEDFIQVMDRFAPTIKMILGGDTIYYKGPFNEPKGFIPNFAFAGAATITPSIKSLSLSERILTIDLSQAPVLDSGLSTALMEEAGEIKAWAKEAA